MYFESPEYKSFIALVYRIQIKLLPLRVCKLKINRSNFATLLFVNENIFAWILTIKFSLALILLIVLIFLGSHLILGWILAVTQAQNFRKSAKLLGQHLRRNQTASNALDWTPQSLQKHVSDHDQFQTHEYD